jgi:hypothetical protein
MCWNALEYMHFLNNPAFEAPVAKSLLIPVIQRNDEGDCGSSDRGIAGKENVDIASSP